MTDNNYAEKGAYGTVVADKFLAELDAAENLAMPDSFNCKSLGFEPNLMQKKVAADVVKNRRVGNWSGTGAGKTVSAVLAAAVADVRNVVVVCPNPTIDGWADTIGRAMPDNANVLLGEQIIEGKFAATREGITNFYILNFHFFQNKMAEERLIALTDEVGPDMIVIDEIHQSKQRDDNESKRRRMLTTLVSECGRLHDDLIVLGMSATPVINNLREAVSLVELIGGVERIDLGTAPTINNALSIHREIAKLGSRWMPDYKIAENRIEIPIPLDDDAALEVRDLPVNDMTRQPHPAHVEQILTKYRIPAMMDFIDENRREDGSVEPTLIYSQYVDGVISDIYQACRERGFKTAIYTGEDKSGLPIFLKGRADVLIASGPISTGVDGLQHVCRRVMVNALPWTSAEYEQLLGRLIRQGSQFASVDVVVPTTEWDSGKDEDDAVWSWCKARMGTIKWKRSLADAVVDGTVPEAQTITPAAATKHAMGWLDRLMSDGMVEEEREIIELEFDRDGEDVDPSYRSASEFSRMSTRWNVAYTGTTHERLQADRSEWDEYHALYREARKDWSIVPAYEIAERINVHNRGKVIADLGCGEKLLSEKLDAHHTVSSFDHVAFDDTVTACDITNLPVEDGSFDIAVMSLAVMGLNQVDYFAEAARVLDVDGTLYVVETDAHAGDRAKLELTLEGFGLTIVEHEPLGKFWFVKATKTA